jgi:pantetheine-phosphate adenylyltransferase
MKRVAVFPGSFDPITKGHEEIVRRATEMFDEIIVAVGSNSGKTYLFTEDQRRQWAVITFADLPNVRVECFQGLTVDFCRMNQANFILRGIRNSLDFEYEMSIARMNKAMLNELETVFLAADTQWVSLSSTIVREIIKNKGQVSQFLPRGINVYE